MKLLIVRHGEPDYEHDSLTEKGFREAEYLAERLEKLPDVRGCYVSPLGRAKATAAPTLARTGWPCEERPWLREFAAYILRPDAPDRRNIAWDWLPQDWTADSRFYDRDRWYTHPVMAEGGVDTEARWVWAGLDEVLAAHGYRREGNLYRAEAAHNGTVILFCHFGVECVLLSHLLGAAAPVLWNGMCAAPSSVTTLVTEERRPGVALFRMTAFGDTSHLYAHGEAPSFSARFRECYANDWERRD